MRRNDYCLVRDNQDKLVEVAVDPDDCIHVLDEGGMRSQPLAYYGHDKLAHQPPVIHERGHIPPTNVNEGAQLEVNEGAQLEDNSSNPISASPAADCIMNVQPNMKPGER